MGVLVILHGLINESLLATPLLVVFLLQKPPFVRHYHKQLVHFLHQNSLVVVLY